MPYSSVVVLHALKADGFLASGTGFEPFARCAPRIVRMCQLRQLMPGKLAIVVKHNVDCLSFGLRQLL